MGEKELLELYEKYKNKYGSNLTYDEFSIKMQGQDYRKQLFNNVRNFGKIGKKDESSYDFFGEADFDKWEFNKWGSQKPVDANNLKDVSNNNVIDGISGNEIDNIPDPSATQMGTRPGSPGARSPKSNIQLDKRFDAIPKDVQDAVDKENEEREAEELYRTQLDRASQTSGLLSDAISQGKDLNDLAKIYSKKTGNGGFDTKLAYYDNDIDDPERKGKFEAQVIRTISEDYFKLYEKISQDPSFQKNKAEFDFLYNEINSTQDEISALREKAKGVQDPEILQGLQDQINDIIERPTEWNPDKSFLGASKLEYANYKDLATRYNSLLKSENFSQYSGILNVIGKMNEYNENFDKRNPEYKKILDEQKAVQKKVDTDDSSFGFLGTPKVYENNVVKPLRNSVMKGLRDIATLPRTVVGLLDNDYGPLDQFADFSEELLDPKKYAMTTLPSNMSRGFAEDVVKVDGFDVVVDEDNKSQVLEVRNSDGFLVDNEEAKEIAKKYTDNTQDYEVEKNYNPYVLLNKTVGVMGDLGILMLGTKGISAVSKGTGKVLAKRGLTRTGNFLQSSNTANRIGLTGAIYGQSHNELYNEAIRNGLSGSEASWFANTGSLTIAAIGQFNPQFFLLGTKSVASKFTTEYAKILAGGVSRKQAIKQAIKTLGIQGLKETGEELAEIPGVNLVRDGFNKKIVAPDKQFQVRWSYNEGVETAILGFAGGFFGGIGNVNSSSRIAKEATFRAYSNKETFQNKLDEIVGSEVMGANGKMIEYTQPMADAAKKYYNDVFEIYEEHTSNRKVDDNVALEILDLAKIKHAINVKSEQTKDKGLKAELFEKYNIVDGQIKKMVNENTVLEEVQSPEMKVDDKTKVEENPEANIKEEEKIKNILPEEFKPKVKQPENQTKVEGDQNTITNPNQNTKSDFNENIVPGHFTMLYNDAFGIKVYGPKDKNGTKDLDRAVNRAMKESKTYQEALGKLKKLNPKGEIKQNSKPKPLFTKDEITTAKATGDYLTPLVKRLKENFPGVKVVIDSKAVEELALSQGVSPEGAKTARGVYDAKNNRVLINPKTANKDTPIHEFGHVWTRLAKQERKELWDKGMSLIADSNIVKNLRKQIAQNPDLQKVYTEDKILDEALAIAIGQRGAKIFESQEAQGIWDNWIKEFFDFIKNKFNVKSEGDIENLTLREFIELASTEILTGEKIVSTESKSEPEVKADENGQTLLFQANYVDAETEIEFTYDKNGDVFNSLVESGNITKDRKLSDFAGTNMILHSPDFAFSGQISKNGNVLIEGKGGMYYPIKFHDKGYFWASTSGAANSMVKLLNDALKNSPDGKIRMALTTAPPTKVMSSTTAANGVVDLFTSDAFINTLNLTEQRAKRSLVIAANTSKKIKVKVENKKTGKEEFKLKDVGLGMKLSNKMSLEEIKSEIRKKLGADNSTFNDRKLFTDEVFRSVAKKLNDQNVNASKKLHSFFKRQFPALKGTGGKVSMTNLSSAVSYLIGEPILRNETETGNVYAVLEAEGQVEPVEAKNEAGELIHESYPFAIKMSNPESKVTLNILTDRQKWSENFEIDNQVNEDGSKKTLKQIYPSYGITTTSLKVKDQAPMFQLEDSGIPIDTKLFNAIQDLKSDPEISQNGIENYFNREFGIDKQVIRDMYNGIKPDPKLDETKERSYWSRISQSLSGESQSNVSEEAKKYVPKTNDLTKAEGDIILKELGLEKTINLINEDPVYLQPEVKIALTNKIVPLIEEEIKKLEDNPDAAGVLNANLDALITKLAKEGTEAGRFIQAFSLLDALAPQRLVKHINNRLKQKTKKDTGTNNEFEITELTPEQEAEIIRLKKIVDEQAEGLPKAKAHHELYTYIEKTMFGKLSTVQRSFDLFKAYFYSSILSGFTTPIRNITANMMSIVSEAYVGAVHDVTQDISNSPSNFVNSIIGMYKGFGKGLLNARYVLNTGIKPTKSDKFDVPSTLEWFRWNNDSIVGKIANHWAFGFVPGIGLASPNFYKYVQRVMVAGDVLFFHAAKDMRAYALASRIKKGDNVTAADMEMAENIISPPEVAIDKAVKQATEEGFNEGSVEFRVRVNELIEENRSQDLQNDTEDYAARATFNYEPEGSLKIVYDAVVAGRNHPSLAGPIITTFIPFARVLTNVFNRFIDWTPAGYVRAIKGGKPLVGKQKFTPLTKEQKAHLYIKATTATLTIAGLLTLIGDEDDEDAKIKISAGGPKNMTNKYELEETGWRPYTITIGDKQISYIDNPLFFSLLAAANIKQGSKYDDKTGLEIAAGIVGSMFEQSWLQGITDLGKFLSKDMGEEGIEKAIKVIGSMTLSNFHRQMIRTYMDATDTPIKDKNTGPAGVLNPLLRDFPYLNSGFDDMYNTKGDPIVPNMIEKFVPFKFSLGRDSDKISELLTDNGIFRGNPGRRSLYEYKTKKSRKQTDKEYARYKALAAKKLGQKLLEQYSSLKDLSPEKLHDKVSRYKRKARERAFKELDQQY